MIKLIVKRGHLFRKHGKLLIKKWITREEKPLRVFYDQIKLDERCTIYACNWLFELITRVAHRMR